MKDVYLSIDFLVINSKGGYTFNDVYHFPVNHRVWTVNQMINRIEKHNKEIEDASNNNK